ncbi:MAG: cytochrome c [Pseudomonadota bacterium]
MNQKHILSTAFCTIACIGLATAPFAGGHSPVEKREAAMGTVGQTTETLGKMLKGEIDFDAAGAAAALAQMQAAVDGFADLYPDGTQGQTTNAFLASDAVWSDSAGFAAQVAKFQGAIDAAVAAAPADKAALGAVFGPIGGSCRSCHQGYRTRQ